MNIRIYWESEINGLSLAQIDLNNDKYHIRTFRYRINLYTDVLDKHKKYLWYKLDWLEI